MIEFKKAWRILQVLLLSQSESCGHRAQCAFLHQKAAGSRCN